ncbi:MAG: CoA transferase, partial [Gaiellaceae bacterium]
MTSALAGIRFVDPSRLLAGPLVGHTLGDLGAEVIKVESPHGD